MSGAGPSTETPRRSERKGADVPDRFGRVLLPPIEKACRCTSGLCLSCHCSQNNFFCSERCACNNNHCRNRPRIITLIQLVPAPRVINNYSSSDSIAFEYSGTASTAFEYTESSVDHPSDG